MLSFSVTPNGRTMSLAKLIEDNLSTEMARLVGDRDDFRMDCILQAPDSNTSNINIGSASNQSGFIVPGGSFGTNTINLNKTYVSDQTAGDVLVILLMD